MPSLITVQVDRLISDFGFTPITASEIEFYLIGSQQCEGISSFWNHVEDSCRIAGITLFGFGREDGLEQYEASIRHGNDPLKTVRDTLRLKNIITDVAPTHGMTANFSAKPFKDRPGSGLHLHVHLADSEQKNLFYKDDTIMSDALRHSIGGLLEWLPDCMAIFAPYEDSYARFTEKNNAPTTVSWGANNRIVAIRLPMSTPANKRIEHRVSGADADPEKVMMVILAAMHYGLTYKSNLGIQVYGDASLAMYDLPRLPASLKEATQYFQNSIKIIEYFSASDLLPDR